MPTREPSLYQLVEAYARLGIESWEKGASAELQSRAGMCLGEKRIVGSSRQFQRVIAEWRNGESTDQLRFIPMPKHTKTIDRAFFLLSPEHIGENIPRTSFNLFLLVSRGSEGDPMRERCLSLRWEAPEPGETTHGYGHVQLCRNIAKEQPPHSGVPNWLPDSYPAIPIATVEPIGMFLIMATAVHGYRKGLLELIPQLFPNDFASAKTYVELLQKQIAT